eukprot:5072559-Prymnesium_polylepis.1
MPPASTRCDSAARCSSSSRPMPDCPVRALAESVAARLLASAGAAPHIVRQALRASGASATAAAAQPAASAARASAAGRQVAVADEAAVGRSWKSRRRWRLVAVACLPQQAHRCAWRIERSRLEAHRTRRGARDRREHQVAPAAVAGLEMRLASHE